MWKRILNVFLLFTVFTKLYNAEEIPTSSATDFTNCPLCGVFFKQGNTYLKQLAGVLKDASPGLSKIANKVTDLSDLKLQKFLSSIGSELSLLDDNQTHEQKLNQTETASSQIDSPSEDSVKNQKFSKTNSTPLIRFLSLLHPTNINSNGSTLFGKCPPIHVLRSCSLDDLSLVLQEKLLQQFYVIFLEFWKNLISKENIFSDIFSNDLN